MPGIGADDESLLPEIADEEPATLDIRWRPGHDDEELTCLGGIRITEYWRCDVALSVESMLPREMGRGIRADSAHRKMNCAAPQSNTKAEVRASKRDIENGVVVRKHADDDVAVEQIVDIRRGAETEGGDLIHPLLP